MERIGLSQIAEKTETKFGNKAVELPANSMA
jgi:hypothetical protein